MRIHQPDHDNTIPPTTAEAGIVRSGDCVCRRNRQPQVLCQRDGPGRSGFGAKARPRLEPRETLAYRMDDAPAAAKIFRGASSPLSSRSRTFRAVSRKSG
jgi:hypothetical protein